MNDWVITFDTITAEEWARAGAQFSGYNIYQTWDYAGAHTIGPMRRISRALACRGGRPVAMAQFRLKTVPMLGVGVAECNWGPLWREDEAGDDGHLEAFLHALREEYCGRRGLNLRLELRGEYDEGRLARLLPALAAHGFVLNPGARAYRTIMLDLSLGLEQLRRNLHGKWRNSLKSAEKAGLQAEWGTSLEYFDRFRRLYDEMWAQKRFATGVRLPAMRDFQARAPEAAKMIIWIIRDGPTDIAGGTFSALGDTMLYFLGASSPRMRSNSNPGYLLQWSNLQLALARGLRYYDLGGLSDREHSGVDLFKVRTEGKRVMFPGWFEAHASAWSSRCYGYLEKGLRRSRALLRRSH